MVMMGPLHIEMMLLKTVEDWVEGSGWTDALFEAEIPTEGRAESLTKAISVTKSRYAHQVLNWKNKEQLLLQLILPRILKIQLHWDCYAC